MSSKIGCFRPALFGCLGIVAILVIGFGIASIFALKGVKQQRVEDRTLETAAEVAPEMPGEVGGVESLPPGRVIVELAHGEFYIHPGEPGTGVRVTARFDQESYELADGLETLDDGTWIYHVRYHRTVPGLQAILQSMFGGNNESRVDVYLPPDVPIALELHMESGACEAELGGLWLTEGQLTASKGGFNLNVSEPLREPVNVFSLTGSMGGLNAYGLGNASPGILEVNWRMGGANIDLSGDWRRHCDAALSVDMGGMSVIVPREITLERVTAEDAPLQEPPSETASPVLRLQIEQKRGEVEVVRR